MFQGFACGVRSKWLQDTPKCLEDTRPGLILDKSCCDGQTLVVSYVNSFIDVYDLPKLYRMQTLEVCLSGNEFIWVDTNTKLIVSSKSNTISLYKRNADFDQYCLEGTFCVDIYGSVKYSTESDFAEKNFRKSVNIVMFISGDVLWIVDRNRGFVRLVDIPTKQFITDLNNKIYEDVRKRGGKMLACNKGEIDVYKENGTIDLELRRKKCVQVHAIEVGKAMLAAVLILMDERSVWKEVVVWDNHTGNLIYSFNISQDALLRVSLNEIVLLRFGYRSLTVSIHQPYTKQTMFEETFDYLSSFSIHEAKSSYRPLSNKYLVCLPVRSVRPIRRLENGDLCAEYFSDPTYFTYFYDHVTVSFNSDLNGVQVLIKCYI